MKYMNSILIASFIIPFIFTTIVSFAQGVQWAKNFGGTLYEGSTSSCQTMDGGYALLCSSNSNNGDFTQNNGAKDGGIIRFDASGNLLWAKNYGGSGEEYGRGILQTPDSGFIISCPTSSKNGDFSSNKGDADFGVLKTDKDGIMQWSKNYGGSLSDWPNTIQKTNDGGFILVGTSFSKNGDFILNKGEGDFALIKIDHSGVKQWSKTYGGSGLDNGRFVLQTMDGGYILVGDTKSKNGDFVTNKGEEDIGVIKTDVDGNILWTKTFGGSKTEFGEFIQQTTDGNYIIAGASASNNGVFTQNHGSFDFCIIKIDANGNKLWAKNLGGSGYDTGSAIRQTQDGGYIIVGYSGSADGDFSQNNGGGDIGVLKIDPNGLTQWSRNYGGSLSDYGYGIQLTADSGFLMVSTSNSSDGDFNQNHGNGDVGVIKLCGRLNPVISGDLSYCKGKSTVLSVGSEFSSYSWSIGGDQPSIVVSSPGTISVTVSDGECSDTATVTVTEKPGPSVMITGESGYCEGKSSGLFASGFFGTCIWDNGSTTENIIVNSPGTYIVTVTDANLCTAVDSVTVTQYPIPDPEIIGNPYFCKGNSTSLGLTQTYTSYSWSEGSDTSTIHINIPGKYFVTVTDVNSCIGIDSAEVFQNENPKPVITGNFSFCEGDSTILTTSHDFSYYFWGDSTQTEKFLNVTSAGQYIVTVKDSNMCTGSDTVYVFENSIPTPVITGDSIFCPNGSTILSTQSAYNSYSWTDGYTNHSATYFTPGEYAVTVTDVNGCIGTTSVNLTTFNPIDTSVFKNGNILTSAADSVSYHWIDCDNSSVLDNADKKEFTPVSSGNYAVILTDINFCKDTSNCYLIVLSGTSDKNYSEIKLFPNPSSGQINIISEGVSNIEICDLSGRIIEKHKIFNIDNLLLKKGIYIIKITSNFNSQSFKVVITD